MADQRSLHKKLAQVMYEAERIPKRGKAPQAMGGFEFVQVGDAADYIRKALAEKVVSMVPSAVDVVGETEHETKSGGTMTTLELRVTWTLTDGESGETATIQSFGAGADTGDKYSGKAMTNAMKYALLAGFLLSTGDDVELADTSDRRTRTEVYSHDKRPPAALSPVVGSLIGVVEVGKTSDTDFEYRPDPQGIAQVGFVLVEGRKRQKVHATGELAEDLMVVRENLMGQRATCWGNLRAETFRPANATRDVTYYVLDLERITSGAIALPVNREAPSVPMFDAEAERELDAIA